MGLLDKVKNMFIEEIEEDEPVKKEVIQVKIPSPEIEEKPKEEIKEEVIEDQKADEKFVFPIFFDDKDFEKIGKPEEKPEIEKTSFPKREAYGIKKEEKVEKKLFKPTPIISPVYGVLDKNYHKDDIKTKKRVSITEYQSNEKVDIDDIRKKAYGTLEDELENNLFEKTSILFNDEVETSEEEKNDDLLNMFDEPRHEQKIEFEEDIILEDDFQLDEPFEDESDNLIEEQLNKTYEEKEPSYVDELNDSDLFNLIDSMYEKKEDE